MVVAVLKIATRILIPAALTVVLKGMVAIKRVQVVIRMAQAQIAATLIWTMEAMTVTVGIRMTEAETPVRVEAQVVAEVKKGTLMRKWRLG
jgi:hypothetical protein